MSFASVPKWIRTGWGYRVASIDELMRAISRIGTLQAGRRYVWRGVRDWHWRIRTSLQRYALEHDPSFDIGSEIQTRTLEQRILSRARYWRLDRAGTLSDPALLALLQHHGSPTRLLDVTSDPMTALWFACDQPPPPQRGVAGALFAFDITELEHLDTSVAGIPATLGSIGSPNSWHYESQLSRSSEHTMPFAIEPSERDARMTAQQGLFLAGAIVQQHTIPGLDAFGLLATPPGADKLEVLFQREARGPGRPTRLPFIVLVIPSNLKQRMRLHLETTYARERRALFPDLAGLADALSRDPVPVHPLDGEGEAD